MNLPCQIYATSYVIYYGTRYHDLCISVQFMFGDAMQKWRCNLQKLTEITCFGMEHLLFAIIIQDIVDNTKSYFQEYFCMVVLQQ